MTKLVPYDPDGKRGSKNLHDDGDPAKLVHYHYYDQRRFSHEGSPNLIEDEGEEPETILRPWQKYALELIGAVSLLGFLAYFGGTSSTVTTTTSVVETNLADASTPSTTPPQAKPADPSAGRSITMSTWLDPSSDPNARGINLDTVGQMGKDSKDTGSAVCDGMVWGFDWDSPNTFTLSGGGSAYTTSGSCTFDGMTLHLTNMVQTLDTFDGTRGRSRAVADMTYKVIQPNGMGTARIGKIDYKVCAPNGQRASGVGFAHQ